MSPYPVVAYILLHSNTQAKLDFSKVSLKFVQGLHKIHPISAFDLHEFRTRFVQAYFKICAMFLQDGIVILIYMEAIQDNIRDRGISTSPLPTKNPFPRQPQRLRKRNDSRTRLDTLRRARSFAADVIAETLWPTRCAICDKPGAVLCRECASKINYIDTVRACPKCGAPFGTIQCTECNDVSINAIGLDSFPFKAFASAVHIDEDTKRIVTIFKDHDEHRLAEIIAKTMCRYINPIWVSGSSTLDPLFISFIPSTEEAMRRRGFDHMAKIASLIGAYTHLRVCSIFERPDNKDQRKLGRRDRVLNMGSKFVIKPNISIPERILLIDDITTTGSTLLGAAAALKQEGCSEIYGLTFGKVC